MVDRYQSRISVPTAPIAVPRTNSLVAAAAGVDAVARTVQDIASRKMAERAQRDDTMAYALATSRYERALRAIEREERENSGAGGSGYVGAVQGRAKDARDQILGELPTYVSENGRARITQAFEIADLDSSERAATWADAQNQSWREDGLREVWGQRYADIEANPDSAPDVLTEMNAYVDAAGLPPDVRRQIKREFIVEAAEAGIQGYLAEGDYDAALESYEAVRRDMAPAEQRALDRILDTWANQNTPDATSLEDRHDAMVYTLLYDAEARDLDAAEEYLRANRDEMGSDDYGQHLKALRAIRDSGSGEGGANVVEFDVAQRVRDGELAGVALETTVRDLLADGSINGEAARRILNQAETRQTTIGRAGLDFITAAFKQPDFLPVFDNGLALAEQDARAEFSAWLRANPDASLAQAREAAVRIAADITDDNLAALPDVGAFGRPSSIQDVARIAQEITTARAAGTLTLDETAELLGQLDSYQSRLAVKEGAANRVFGRASE